MYYLIFNLFIKLNRYFCLFVFFLSILDHIITADTMKLFNKIDSPIYLSGKFLLFIFFFVLFFFSIFSIINNYTLIVSKNTNTICTFKFLRDYLVNVLFSFTIFFKAKILFFMLFDLSKQKININD